MTFVYWFYIQQPYYNHNHIVILTFYLHNLLDFSKYTVTVNNSFFSSLCGVSDVYMNMFIFFFSCPTISANTLRKMMNKSDGNRNSCVKPNLLGKNIIFDVDFLDLISYRINFFIVVVLFY